jgi:hypothetical protein
VGRTGIGGVLADAASGAWDGELDRVAVRSFDATAPPCRVAEKVATMEHATSHHRAREWS